MKVWTSYIFIPRWKFGQIIYLFQGWKFGTSYILFQDESLEQVI